MVQESIISPERMAELVGRSKKTIWRWWSKEKAFPKPVLVNGRAIGWRESDYKSWLNSGVGA